MPAPFRFGLIGAGRWGRVYIKTLSSLAERCHLTHLCTSQPHHASLVPGPVEVSEDWRVLLKSECDAVIIATPPNTHAELVEACVRAGKPCIVEKPLCLDIATAERLHQLVQESRIPVLVDHTHLFDPAYLTLKQTLERTPESIRLIISEGMGWGPFRADTPALWDWCPHDFSLCFDLLGQTPRHAEAFGGPRGPDGSPEQICIRLEFSGGSCAWIQAGRLSWQKRRNLAVVTDHHAYRWDAVAAEKLTMSSIDFPQRYRQAPLEVPQPTPIAVASTRQPLDNLVHYFLEGLAGGDRQRFGTQLALEVVRWLAVCETALSQQEMVG